MVKPSSTVENDISRRNTIANLLKDWGLVNIVGELARGTAPLKSNPGSIVLQRKG